MAARLGIDLPIDFSANVNPAGPPPSVIAALRRSLRDGPRLARYPEPTAARLREAAARLHGVDPACIVVGNGTAALLDAIVRVCAPERALLAVPAFSEYARALDAAGCRRVGFALDPERDFAFDIAAFVRALARIRPNLVIFNNPHNPSGTCLRFEDAARVRDEIVAAGAVALVDEAFADYVPEVTLTATAGERTIVLRSLTKVYGMASLRVGYAVCSPEFAERVRRMLASWPVSTLAVDAAVAALSDAAFVRVSLERNARARDRLAGGLRALGLRVVRPSANFVYAEFPRPHRSAQIVERLLLEHGIAVRDCATYAELAGRSAIRVAVLDEERNALLLRALAQLLNLQCEV